MLSNGTEDLPTNPGTEHAKRLKYLRCDNAKEFLNSAFKECLSTQGAVLQDILDYTLELNRTPERDIWTVMNMNSELYCRTGFKSLWNRGKRH